jgi:hypothetical protein
MHRTGVDCTLVLLSNIVANLQMEPTRPILVRSGRRRVQLIATLGCVKPIDRRRDDFSAVTKEPWLSELASSARARSVDRATSYPQADPMGSVNMGVAAHISVASIGGPQIRDACAFRVECSRFSVHSQRLAHGRHLS